MKIIPIPAHAGITGFESPAKEYEQKTLLLDDVLIEHPSATYIGIAQGDSLKDVGVYDQDILIIDQQITPQQLDVVTAILNGETVCYVLDKVNGSLLPANAEYQPISINDADDFRVIGVVIRSVRCFRPSRLHI